MVVYLDPFWKMVAFEEVPRYCIRIQGHVVF